MTATRKWIYVSVGLALVLVLLNFGIQSWVKSKLPEIFQDNTTYELQFKEIDVSIFRSSLTLEDIIILPKNLPEKSSDSLVVNIHDLKISGINLFKLLFKDAISISSIKVNAPEIHYTQFLETQKDSISSDPENQNNIAIKTFEIEGRKLYFSDSKESEPK